jgi:cytochrome c
MQLPIYAVLLGAALFSVPVAALAAGPQPAAPATAAAPSGAADFTSRCGGCHTVEPGANRVGPSLAGIYGRTSGTAPGYTYSAALKNAKIVWDAQTLDKFLQSPAGLVHGTKMFVSLPDPAARQHIIAYLQALKPQAAAGK